MNILIRRGSAFGDVLCATPVAARVRAEHPDAFIGFHTNYGAVLQGNPHIDGINIDREWNRVIDLDMAHETRRNMHAIEAYMEVGFGDHGENADKSVVFVTSMLPILKVDWKKTIAIHANKSWQNRTMPNEWWDQVAGMLGRAGYHVVVLGMNIDHCPAGLHVVDTRDKLTMHQQGAVIAASQAFICGASGLFILAAATETPVVVPLTINRPETALPWRHGQQGWGYHAIVADVPCIGCSERAGPVTSLGCERGDYACIPTIKAEVAAQLAMRAAEHGGKWLRYL